MRNLIARAASLLALLAAPALAQPLPGNPGPGPVPGAVLDAEQSWLAPQHFNAGITSTTITATGNITFSGTNINFARLGVGTRFTGGVTPDSTLEVSAAASAAPGSLPAGTVLHVVGAGTGGVVGRALVDAFGASPVINGRRANNTVGSPSGVATDDPLLTITANGYTNASAYGGGSAQVQLSAAETWTSTANGSYVRFLTTPTGSIVAAERMRLFASGAVGIGVTTDPGPTTMLSVAGTNTGGNIALSVTNNGTAATANTAAVVQIGLNAANTLFYMQVLGGVSPSALIQAQSALTGGVAIASAAGPMILNTRTTLQFQSNSSAIGDYGLTTSGKWALGGGLGVNLGGSAINANTIFDVKLATNEHVVVRDSSGVSELAAMTDVSAAYAPLAVGGSTIKFTSSGTTRGDWGVTTGSQWTFSTTVTFVNNVAVLGSSSGTITLVAQAAAGTWNWNWPTGAGSAGQVLTSQGGGASAMTWVTPTITINTVACTIGSSCTISAAASLVVASTTITGTCTNGFVLFNNAGVLGCQAAGAGTVAVSGTPTNGQMAQWTNATTIQGINTTGSGNAVLATAPTVSSLTVTTSFTATGLVTNADLANASTTVGGATCTLGSTCLGTATGTGNLVLATSPTMSGVTVTGSFTATGLVTNADLANSATTVNGQTCTLGSTCTVTAAAGTLTGATLAAGVTASSLTSLGTLTSLTVSGTITTNLTGGGTQCVQTSNTGVLSGTGSACGSGSGAVNSVSNSDATLTISPTTGSVVASLNLGHINTWSAAQTFSGGASVAGLTVTSSFTATGLVGLGALATQSANTIVANATGSTASPTAIAIGSCSTASSALIWTTSTGFGCNTSITAAAMAASGLTGLVAMANGGTNKSNTADLGAIAYSDASGIVLLAHTTTASLPLLSGNAAAPTWAAISYPTSATSGGVAYFSGTTVMQSSATLATGCIVYGGGGGNAPLTSTSTCPTVTSAGVVAIANTTASSSGSTTGALTVAGGVYSAGNAIFSANGNHQFGARTGTKAALIVAGGGAAAGAGAGAVITVQNDDGAGGVNNAFLLGNFSAVAGGAYTIFPMIYGQANIGVYVNTLTQANFSLLIGNVNTPGTSSAGTLQIQGGMVATQAVYMGGGATAGVILTLQNTAGTCTHTPTSSAETVSCSSDERLKISIRDAAPVLPDMMRVRVRDYVVRSDGSDQTGVVAQEMLEVSPRSVRVGDRGIMMVDAPNPWKLLKAIQELKADNDNLRVEMDRIRSAR